MIENNQQNNSAFKTPFSTQPEKPKGPVNDIRIEDIIGSIQTVLVAPTGIPKTFWDSIKLFNDSGTYYLYIYMQGVGWVSTVVT